MSPGGSGDFRPPAQFSPPVFPPPVFPSAHTASAPNTVVPQAPPPHNRANVALLVSVLVVGLAIVAAIVTFAAPEQSGVRTDASAPTTETVPAQPLLPVPTQGDRDEVEQSLRTFYAGLGGNGASGGQVCGIFQTLWENDLRDQTFRIDFVDTVDISTTSAYVDYTASKFRPGAPAETVQLTTLLKNEGGVWKWCGTAGR